MYSKREKGSIGSPVVYSLSFAQPAWAQLNWTGRQFKKNELDKIEIYNLNFSQLSSK